MKSFEVFYFENFSNTFGIDNGNIFQLLILQIAIR